MRLQMETEDIILKTKSIQLLKVTKELQERLMQDNVQGKDQHRIEVLEKTLEINEDVSTLSLIIILLTYILFEE